MSQAWEETEILLKLWHLCAQQGSTCSFSPLWCGAKDSLQPFCTATLLWPSHLTGAQRK